MKVLCLLIMLIATKWGGAQPRWTWVVMEAYVEGMHPDLFTLTLGLRADSAGFAGRLGNCNVRGTVSEDLADFNGLTDPLLSAFPQGYAVTLTNGPDDSDWQINMVLETGDGLRIDTSAVPVITMTFTIENAGGRSGLVFLPLQQTFLADYRTAVAVSFDSAGGDVGLLPSGINDEGNRIQPREFTLAPNYPNPFNASTTLTYTLPRECHVRCDVIASSGQFICSLVNTLQGPGSYSTVWNGVDERGYAQPSGVYMITLRAGSFYAARKVIMLR